MVSYAFAVHDKAVGAFMPPFFARSRGEAIRSFITACSGDKGPFVNNRADYVLFSIGSFDDVSGRFETVEPDRLMSALEAVSSDE